MKLPNLPKWQQIALPVVVILLSIYYFGKFYVADELIYARYQVRALETDLQAALDRIEDQKMRTAVAQREADVAARANDLLRDSERQRQDEIARLQADLAFYRRLGGASGSQAALAVHHLELQTTRSTRVYRIIFTLTQNLRWASKVSGNIRLGLDGIRNNAAAHLSGAQLLADAAEPLRFQFKYFQQLERLITLPEGFEPERLTVYLDANGVQTPVEQSMEWHSLFVQPGPGSTPDKEQESAHSN